MIPLLNQKIALQIIVAIAACVPVLGGLSGILADKADTSSFILSSNHFNYLSGLLLAIGLLFWGFIPTIEKRSTEIRLLTIIVFTGGLARLISTVSHSEMSMTILFALVMELIITPAICVWQYSISRRSGRLS